MAEPRITEAAITLLENVAGKPRRDFKLSDGPAARAILGLKPAAWWRLNEFAGPHAIDASGNHRDALYEREIVYYLEGPRSGAFCDQGKKPGRPLRRGPFACAPGRSRGALFGVLLALERHAK